MESFMQFIYHLNVIKLHQVSPFLYSLHRVTFLFVRALSSFTYGLPIVCSAKLNIPSILNIDSLNRINLF